MAEVTDYTRYLPAKPPAEIVNEMCSRHFTEQQLIFRQGSEYDEITGKRVQAVECTCTGCHTTSYLKKVKAPGCVKIGNTAYGFYNPETLSDTFDGNKTVCPVCGGTATARHCSHYSYQGWGTLMDAVFPVTVHNIQGAVALLYWYIGRYIDPYGNEHIDVSPHEGYLYWAKKRVCVTGKEKMFYQIRNTYRWRQLRRYRVDVGSSYASDVYFMDDLTGSEAENAHLEKYCASAGNQHYPVRYMELWQKYKSVENLIMQGLGGYVTYALDYCAAYDYNGRRSIDVRNFAKYIDVKRKKPHEMLGISKPELKELQGRYFKPSEIEYYISARRCGVPISNMKTVMKSVPLLQMKYMAQYGANFYKVQRYLAAQKRKYPKDTVNITFLKDYWDMAKENGADLTRSEIMYPQRLKNAHDTAMREKKWKADEKLCALFKKRAKELEKYSFEDGNLSIHAAQSEHEMIVEGKLLEHCVAGYAASHASGETSIFFIRHTDEPQTPYFTMEYDFQNMRVVQNRGYDNCKRTDEVIEFEKKWVSFVKETAAKERKAA